ncbi:MAG: transketolase, partial [Elusimicrobia bacterium]
GGPVGARGRLEDGMRNPTAPDIRALEAIARKVRAQVVSMSHEAGVPHLGSSLSCVDILVALYWGALAVDPAKPKDPERDRAILSKGHAATTLYTVLAHRGFFPGSELSRFNQDGGPMQEHPGPGCMPGVEVATGSLGHGLSLGLGMALSGKVRGRDFRTYVVMSDGELNEGSVWEAAQFAPAKGLDRVMAIVDFNKWQATGRSREVLALDPLREKWEAFGWKAVEVDGHDMGALTALMRGLPEGGGKPVAVIAHTVKGRGVSFMEDDNNWHYRIPTSDEVLAAHRELGVAA